MHELSPETREAAAYQKWTAAAKREQPQTTNTLTVAAAMSTRPRSAASSVPLVPPSTPVPTARPLSRTSALASGGDEERDVTLASGRLAVMADSQPELNAPDASGRPPLYYAVSQHNLPTAQFLIDAGADLSSRDRHGIHLKAVVTLVGIEFIIVDNRYLHRIDCSGVHLRYRRLARESNHF